MPVRDRPDIGITDSQISFRCSRLFRDMLRDAAKEEGLSMQKWIDDALWDALRLHWENQVPEEIGV